MIRVAIVEDEQEYRTQLREYVLRFAKEMGMEFKVEEFSQGARLIEHYKPVWDIILLDIQMPGINGMETAQYIRKQDDSVVIVFITNMVNYALKGCEVNAFDFIVKPIAYPIFSMKLKKVCRWVDRTVERYLILPIAGGIRKISADEVCYIEVIDHRLLCHTIQEDILLTAGTLTSMEKQLAGRHFCRCNNCYLVNLRHVSDIRRDSVIVSGVELAMSRSKKKDFLKSLTEYVGGK